MRVKRGFAGRRRHKKILKRAEGFRGRKSGCYKLAKRAVQKALVHAYRHRRTRKRDFRSLWIARINAGARLNGISYSRLIRGLTLANVAIDRKILADLAWHSPMQFGAVVERAKAALG